MLRPESENKHSHTMQERGLEWNVFIEDQAQNGFQKVRCNQIDKSKGQREYHIG